MHRLVLPGDGTDFIHWREAARSLWAAQRPPELVEWLTEAAQSQHPDLFAASHPATSEAAGLPTPSAPPLTVPRWWPKQAECCLLNSSEERFGLLYRSLWRMQHEQALRHDPLDADHLRMQRLCNAVRREIHKVHAFVRFRPMPLAEAAEDGSGPLHVAWIEPEHHVMHAAAPFFVRRFTNMRWALMTPQCSLRWWPQAPNVAALAAHGITPANALQPWATRPGVLSWGPGGKPSDAPPPDAGEALWLTYYANIFNPARLKLNAMRKEMPRKYWANLPEAQLIDPLIQAAQSRTGTMLTSAPSTPRRRLPHPPARQATHTPE